MAANNPEQAKLVKQVLEDYPKLGNTAAARKVKELYPDTFKDTPVETIRSSIRYYRGNRGKKLRDDLKENKYVKLKQNHQANLKILLFDIETTALEGKAWSKWSNLMRVTRDSFILCWSAKWLFDDNIYNSCITPKEIKRGDDDSRVVKNLWHMLEEADIVIAHNGDKFDIKKANTRFVLNGMPPVSYYRSVDTLKIAKQNFRFYSNRLNDLAKFFGVPGKIPTDHELWFNAENGDPEALKQMQVYCDQDIRVLEDVYLKLRPYHKNHPNIGLLVNPSELNCRGCGHHDLKPTGKEYYTNTYAYEILRCNNCGKPNYRPNAARPKGHNLLK